MNIISQPNITIFPQQHVGHGPVPTSPCTSELLPPEGRGNGAGNPGIQKKSEDRNHPSWIMHVTCEILLKYIYE